jgi:PadR family transcriptional regulator, regulatory protein PadR
MSTLAELEQVILLAILQVGDEAYGVPVLEEIRRRTGRRVSRGALYVTLDRLEAKGYIASRTGPPSPERGGRSRRLLTVTAAGVRALRASRRALLELWNGLDAVLDTP